MFTDTFNKEFYDLFSLKVFRVDVDASESLDNVNDLKLSEHMLELCLQFFSLPIAKLLICILVAECDNLVKVENFRSISLLLVALHYANHCLVPRDVNRLENVLPLARRLI